MHHLDNTVSPAKTTITDYIAGAVYENDVLQFIPPLWVFLKQRSPAHAQRTVWFPDQLQT
jgi:hypothetical protein